MAFARTLALVFTVSLSALTLSGCGSAPTSVVKSEAELYPAKPQHYPVHGVDISHHQGPVDWKAARDHGTRFAFLKATEGGDYLDDTFKSHWDATREAGIERGAYHFYYWCRNVEDQISWFIRNVPVEPDALPPVLDVEWNGDSKTCPKKVPQAEALAAMKRFLRAVEAHYHKRPIIYTSIDFYREIIDGDLHDYPLWVRTVKAHPVARYANRPWTFWQYTEFGEVDGIKGGVDRNAFVGTEDEWNRFINQQVMVASNTSALPVNQQLASALPPAEGPKGQGPVSNVMVASAQAMPRQDSPAVNSRDELGMMAASFVEQPAPDRQTSNFSPPSTLQIVRPALAPPVRLAATAFPARIPLPPIRRRVLAQN